MKKILIIRFTSLGDLVTLEPTFRAFRAFFKDSEITFLTSGIGKGLFSDSGYFDEFIIHNKFFQTLSLVKNKDFDLVINLQCNRPSHFLNLAISKKKVINKSFNLFQKIFDIKVHSKSASEMIKLTGFDERIVDEYFEKDNGFIKLPTSKSNLFEKNSDNRVIAISTGTSERWLSKKWGVNNYLNLIKELVKNNYQIVLIGSELELEESEFILKNFQNNEVTSFVNKTNLTQLKNLLAEVDLYIGNDSGPSHIAAGVGTNTITIFGSTDIKHCVKFMPYTGIHEYLKPSEDIKCHPCYKTKCPTNMECMASITVNQIINLIVK
ncbi:glycosyltransferase family 9 protein [Arcobacter sp. s6]|uniref:glycosyltransferase family 9 protein n=1 Tax=Arcobacter sp. s6 TaxID=3230363 RepID=UPI0034A0AB23